VLPDPIALDQILFRKVGTKVFKKLRATAGGNSTGLLGTGRIKGGAAVDC
jgi:hypothetical protein